jgi:carboxypeptidase A, invertebrate
MALKITKNASNPIVFIDANIHAREWIASATAVWVINEILTTTDARVRSIIDQVNFIIIPMLNPDGYIYTYNVDRMWRKTRSTHSSLLCTGEENFRSDFADLICF